MRCLAATTIQAAVDRQGRRHRRAGSVLTTLPEEARSKHRRSQISLYPEMGTPEKWGHPNTTRCRALAIAARTTRARQRVAVGGDDIKRKTPYQR